ncbi:MAG: phosphoglucosamine mutase, partial [Pseudomonadota bacterium]|nr:phosphoglucosamine mutase [Pseudomonadota bacterium]
IVLSDYNTTGDGLIAAIEVLSALEDTGNSVSELGRRFQPYPQILENVRFKGNSPLENKTVKEAVDDGESRLRASGRILVRKSGTEPLIRVMAEGADQALVQSVVADIVTAIEQVSN